MRGLWLRLRRVLRWRESERDIDDELRFHVEMETERLRGEGVSPAEARRRARIAFGGEDRYREEVRAARGTAWLEDGVRDVRTALRGLARAPGFAAAALGTIALAVGATTAVWSVVDQVVFSPLPYPEPDELVSVWTSSPAQGVERGMASWPNFTDWRASATTFEALATVVPDRRTLTATGDAREIRGFSVSRGFFELVGTPLLHGRAFRDGEVEVDSARAVVLGHDLFVGAFGSDPGVVGRTVELDGRPFEVAGVAEAGLGYPRDAEYWIPQAFGVGRQWRDPRNRLWLSVVGRLADGVELPAAQREMDRIASGLEADHPRINRGMRVELEPLEETLVGDARTPLVLLLGAVGVVMLIAIVNVANLLLARGIRRRPEMAVRLALGAGRSRLIRQALTGSAVLGVLGGILGAGVAAVGVTALLAAAPPDLPRLDEVRVDGLLLAVSVGCALAAGLVFGLVPALRTKREGGGSRGATAGGMARLRAALVAGQFALAFVLLVGLGLLLRSFLNLRAVDPGFEIERVLSVSLTLPPESYPDREDRHDFHDPFVAGLGALPGVEGVGTVTSLFLSDLPNTGTVTIESRQAGAMGAPDVPVVGDAVSPAFLRTLGMDVVEGRGIATTDGPDDPSVAIVNESFARLHLGRSDAVGERFTWGEPYEGARWFIIVGVVRDARRSGLDAPVQPAVFTPVAQGATSDFEVLLRTEGDPLASVPAVRDVVARLDPTLPLSRVRSLEEAMGASLARRRFVTWILGVFALSALALAAVGISGVMAYTVGLRTREIGIRIALGAARPTVLTSVLREGLVQAAGGMTIGAVAALATTRYVRSELVGLEPTDPLTFGLAASLLLFAATLACLLPARRAASVEPTEALRAE